MVSRLTPSIVLGPTGNLQGTYKFFSLIMGKKIKRRQLTRYPMPDSVITKVERYARAGGTPKALDFANRSGILFKWNDELDESLGELIKDNYVPSPPSRPSSQEWSSSGIPQSRKQSRTTLSPTAAPKTRPPSRRIHTARPRRSGAGGYY
jgi:hypothetical protein